MIVQAAPPTDTRSHEPAYLGLYRRGELAERARSAVDHLVACDLCARYCRVDRRTSARGAVCRTGRYALVASYGPHHGEERPLRGRGGSGTIFFGACNLRCVFCQNWQISQSAAGAPVDARRLAAMMLDLQRMGCHNINLVSPSHVVAQVLEALPLAADAGLRVPLVYNTGGFDSLEALALLDGVVDIYMPDLKYAADDVARRHSRVRGYVAANQAVVREMHRQVGDLVLDDDGVAVRGLLVRHLVLPGDLAGTADVLAFLAREISPDTYVNLMPQYRPCYRAAEYSPLDRPLAPSEFAAALAAARACGLRRLDPECVRA